MQELNFLPVLTCIIIFATVGALIYFDFDLLQPSVTFFATMAMSLLLGMPNIERWNLYVGPDTSIIVICGMAAFLIGSVFFHDSFYKKHGIYEGNRIRKGIYEIPVSVIFICTGIILILLYFSTKELYDLSVELGNRDGLLNMIKTLRYPLERGEIEFSRWNGYRGYVTMALASSFLYFFIYNFIVGASRKFKTWLLLCPVLAYIPFFILSTGRRSAVHFIISGLVLGGILYQQKYGISRHVQTKILKLVGMTGVFAVGLYFLMGFLTGKVRIGGRDPLTIISHYGGLSVPALEQYVSAVRAETQYYLQNTAMGIYGNLNTLGFDLEKGRGFLPFVSFTGTESITTNVYTVFYRLLTDFSFPGLLVVMFIFGIYLTFTYEWLRCHDIPAGLTVYAYYGYIPFFLFIDDQFMGLFTTTTIYRCILITLFLHVIRKRYWRVSESLTDMKNE